MSARTVLASLAVSLLFLSISAAPNSTFENPILPGFYPDPSCIFLKDWDNTFFCASSSFNAFPGIPIHTSKDLRNWKLIGNVLNRPEQLPQLAITNGSTSGIWAPTIRYHDETFYLITTLVQDKKPDDDPTRWDNIIFKSKNPYDPLSWSNAVHFEHVGYDPSLFWHQDGKVYVTGAHAWKVGPGIVQTTINLDTGALDSPWTFIWNGTGGLAPEGPRIYLKDGYYYLMVAEGGTGLDHMETIARSKDIDGPYEPCPFNPILTNANTTSLFQTVGHAELFQDASNNWWGVALSTRSGPSYLNYPMGRETVLAPVTWKAGEWPVWTQISGKMSGWPMPQQNRNIRGIGPYVDDGDNIQFTPGSGIPSHFLYWRLPIESSYKVSPAQHPNTLRLKPSRLNLTALDGNFAGAEGQTFIGRRQSHSLFTYSVNMEFQPKLEEEEAGVSFFLTQNHHADLGVVLLPSSSNNSSLVPHLRFRAVSYVPVPATVLVPVPSAWLNKKLTMEIKAVNVTHYSMSAGLANARNGEKMTIAYAPGEILSWGFTGTLLGVFATTNGGKVTDSSAPAYFSNWLYTDLMQIRA
ncbi:arabinofuranosidase [Crucibulum laeve]|uniref:Arabinofuranosidase n=1 Tax=Crucibulum laeve TaxID=68775 RepID=A0A5C3MH55_9AGAR|nr:arabinofuranosidase [Crucibulum laeve]